MFPTRRSRKTKFHCARGALKHVLQEHFALLVLMQNGHHNIVQCPACLKKFRPAHAVEHLVSCIQMICNACLRVLDVVNPIKLQPDLTLSGYCICVDQYTIKADWVLFGGPDGFDQHPIHRGYLPKRLKHEPTIITRRKGVDQVERNFQELMDCKDPRGSTFDEAIKASLLPNMFGKITNACVCEYCIFVA